MWWRRSTVSTQPEAASERTVARVLLDRLGVIYVPAAPAVTDGQPAASAAVPDPLTSAGVVLLEAELLDRGYLASAALVQRLLGLGTVGLTTYGGLLLADLDAALGSDRSHVPLFRGFPRSVPSDTHALWVDRVLTLIAQLPEQPCALCGRDGTVVVLSPCAHLVCTACFDTHDYSACPICRRHLDTAPLSSPARLRRPSRSMVLPDRARVLTVGTDHRADAHRELDGMLARTAALSPQDTDDLRILLGTREPGDLTWLPEVIPARQTKAWVLAWLLADRDQRAVTLPAIVDRIDTATDALRLLVVLSGGDPGLLEVPRFAAVPRPVRRTVLASLDRIDPGILIEDLRRHRLLWVHAAERLHPFEHAAAYPVAALAFAALRGSVLGEDRWGSRLAGSAASSGIELHGGRVMHRSHGSRVEGAFLDEDCDAAVLLLKARPGEFVRRLDQLLSLAQRSGRQQVDTVLEAAAALLPRVAPAVLISALGELRTRGEDQDVRVFFPSGGAAKIHVVPEERPPLSKDIVERVVRLFTDELLRRSSRLGPVQVALVDQPLDRLIAPFTQRTASRALVTVPRGSLIQLPTGRHLRLFLHWMQAEERVDLDLSTAMFDEAWQHVGTCDYTNMRVAGHGAVHSGDLTDAPAPSGASEFVDIDLERLIASGVRHIVVAVFSYTNTAFEDIPEAFAGVMLRDDEPQAGPVFDARAVEQRFDLVGRARACVPFVIDVRARTMRWLDVVQGVTGTYHAVHRHVGALAEIGQTLGQYYDSGARVSLGEVARWQVAARARTVLIRSESGTLRRFERGSDETVRAFLQRLAIGSGAAEEGIAPQADLAFLYRGDIHLAEGATAFAQHPATLDPQRVSLISAADVAGGLIPDNV